MITYKWIVGIDGDLADAHYIRRVVFMDEQNVPLHEEMIPWEDEISQHLVLYLDGKPAATGRIFIKDKDFILQRIAVLKEYRSKGFGKLITQQLIDGCKKLGANKITLSSQTHAIGFYGQFGFKGYTDEYMDAGIPHISMKLIF